MNTPRAKSFFLDPTGEQISDALPDEEGHPLLPRSTSPDASNRSNFTTSSVTTTGSTSSTSASIAAGSVLPPSPTM